LSFHFDVSLLHVCSGASIATWTNLHVCSGASIATWTHWGCICPTTRCENMKLDKANKMISSDLLLGVILSQICSYISSSLI
jgi:hypothetical protein